MIRWVLAIFCLALPLMGNAHGYKAGRLLADHPYALPTPPGATQGMAFFRTFKKRGRTADRLIGVESPVAEQVSVHQAMPNAAGRPLMRSEPHIDLPPGAEVRFRHNHPDGYHLMLRGLKRPLQVGDRFPLVLIFEQAGRLEVSVWVQQPRDLSGHHNH
jgi:copper(I)-binding protein